MLSDLHMFLLDQKVWLKVKYSVNSDRLDSVSNSAMTVISDGYQSEKIILFGGIQNVIKTENELMNSRSQEPNELGIEPSMVSSCLTNKTYVI